MLRNEKPFWILSQTVKDIPSYGSQSEHIQKLLSTDLVNTDSFYLMFNVCLF